MKTIVCIVLLAILAATAFSEIWQPRLKIITPELGAEYGIGDAGHFDFRLGLRYNLPNIQNLVLGFCIQGGYLFHDTDNLEYRNEYGDLFDVVEDWTDFSYDLFLGWEFSPHKKINPYLLMGVGYASYGFTARNTYWDETTDVDVDGTGSNYFLLLGCDVMVSKYVAVTPYFKYTGYTEDVIVPIEVTDEYGYYLRTERENLNEWRGSVHLGVNVAIPISIERHPDTDGDGVWDDFDMCPDTPPGTIVNERGCPRKQRSKPLEERDLEKEFVDKGIFSTNEIFFEFNSDEITPESFGLLDEVGRILERHKNWRLEIAGHTDSIGSDKYNNKLSLSRAKAVKDYLVSNFEIIPQNLSAIGYGESMPIADNGTTEGRALNRRVEFKIIER